MLDVKRLLNLLEEKGMFQKDFADKIGVTEVSMSRYMSGERNPRPDVLDKMANVLGTSVDYLMGRNMIPDKYEYTEEDKTLGLPVDWIEHLAFIRRAGSQLTREEMDVYIALGRNFAARIEKEEKESKGDVGKTRGQQVMENLDRKFRKHD